MLLPHRIIGTLLLASLTYLPAQAIGRAQTGTGSDSERDRGVELFKQGDAQGAVVALQAVVKRSKDDIIARHYLGLALEQAGKKGDARNAHEKAAKAADKLLTSLLDLNQTSTAQNELLLAGADSADRYLALSDGLSTEKRDEWEQRGEFLRGSVSDKSQNWPVYSGRDVTTKARILSKPEPTYSGDARSHRVTGTVVLKAVFAADGRIRAIRVVKGLPRGLTRKAVLAAQQIKFVPATKDGRPVSMSFQLEYNFNLY